MVVATPRQCLLVLLEDLGDLLPLQDLVAFEVASVAALVAIAGGLEEGSGVEIVEDLVQEEEALDTKGEEGSVVEGEVTTHPMVLLHRLRMHRLVQADVVGMVEEVMVEEVMVQHQRTVA